MDSILKKGVEFCFPPGILQDVALNILQENGKNQSVNSLKILSLKSIMGWKMKKDTYANVIFCLIFREPLNLTIFAKRPSYSSIFKRARQKFLDIFNGYKKKKAIYQSLKKDPFIMKEVLEQNIPYHCDYIEIHIKKSVMRVQYFWWHIVEIAHRENIEYDHYWAAIFTKIVLSKSTNYVKIRTIGDENSNILELDKKMNQWIDNIDRIIPPEGWKEAIENGNQLIYHRGNSQIFNGDPSVTVTFIVQTDYKEYFVPGYWGYIEHGTN